MINACETQFPRCVYTCVYNTNACANARVCVGGGGRGESRTDDLALSKYLIVLRRAKTSGRGEGRGNGKKRRSESRIVMQSHAGVLRPSPTRVNRGRRDGLGFAKDAVVAL